MSPIVLRCQKALELTHASAFHKEFLRQALEAFIETSSKVQALMEEVDLGHRLNFFEHPESLSLAVSNEHIKIAAINLLQNLKSTEDLDLLDLGHDALFEYQGDSDFICHQRIHALALDFMRQPMNRHTYSPVIEIAKQLKMTKDYDIHTVALVLRRQIQEKELRSLTFLTQIAEDDHETNLKAFLVASNAKASDFKEGDFSFIACKETCHFIESAFNYFHGSGDWDKSSISEESWAAFDTAMGGLSGATMALCQANIKALKESSWHEFVRLYLINQAS
jgi:hypothetical protein